MLIEPGRQRAPAFTSLRLRRAVPPQWRELASALMRRCNGGRCVLVQNL